MNCPQLVLRPLAIIIVSALCKFLFKNELSSIGPQATGYNHRIGLLGFDHGVGNLWPFRPKSKSSNTSILPCVYLYLSKKLFGVYIDLISQYYTYFYFKRY